MTSTVCASPECEREQRQAKHKFARLRDVDEIIGSDAGGANAVEWKASSGNTDKPRPLSETSIRCTAAV